MNSLQVRRFSPVDVRSVIDVILPIQREEFGIAITESDQPDLHDIPGFYQVGNGDFFVAEIDGRLVGTIGLKDIGSGQGALRKMFVASDFRGRDHGVAHGLLHHLLSEARARGLQEIYLGTTDRFLAAHRFYEKNGFHPVPVEVLPPSFPRMAVDTRFYRLDLS
ncbi:GNAT family N-acetyltransferase [Methylobacterium oryzihabitans]|uniref:GNAT family N-acetyltransferase n=1 Tax=Methylobacterium oryzihabitans TaxID=2499852 RepID=A0A3S2YNK3_9HYPH|nr:GNAT family N-acetyltransferase [Methylobacterium oryzihabitans]RVU15284.1 GNAT family N-acetyltransferase [Methylobacterium oryzihabitans]